MRISLVVLACAPLLGCAVDSTLGLSPEPPIDPAGVVRVELDVVAGADFDLAALRVAEQSFAAIGITADFVVSYEPDVAVPESLVAREDKHRVLTETRSLPDHVHLVVAPRGAGAHGVTHYPLEQPLLVESAGAFVFAQSIADDYAANSLLADAGLGLEHLVGRTLAHELGHALGCPHGGSADSGTVMVQNSALGPVTREGLGRWRQALAGDGRGFPRFDESARGCLDVAAKLSVERAQPAYLD